MRRQSPIRDRFTQYLEQKMGKKNSQYIVYSSRKKQSPSDTEQWKTPRHNHHGRNQQQFVQSSQPSINSSSLCWSSNATQPLSQNSKFSNGKKTVTIKNKRKLIKVCDKQQNVCSICLDNINDPAQLSCRHTFCLGCLKQWLNTSSKCPYCRNDSPFYVFNGISYEIEQKSFMYEADFPDMQDQQDDGLDYQCYLCENTRQGDTVLICDRCMMHSCHPQCDQRLTSPIMQDEDWYCHFCI